MGKDRLKSSDTPANDPSVHAELVSDSFVSQIERLHSRVRAARDAGLTLSVSEEREVAKLMRAISKLLGLESAD
jgi:hypothetical protein